jgi:transposase
MIPEGVDVYVATEPVDMRYGFERLSGLVRERMGREPRSRALFVFIGKQRRTMKVLTWDGTGVVLFYKKLDAGLFELPLPSRPNERSVRVTETVLDAMFCGLSRVTLH